MVGMRDTDRAGLAARLRELILGRARDIRDPAVLRGLTLVPFFAWVGLGADGLSSSCYGPEESFLALGSYGFLGIFVALAAAATVFIITSSYSQIVELFPAGGGGYVVASKLLSPELGMVSGCALLIDYVLTITLSIASGADAVFSFLPLGWVRFKVAFALGGLAVLAILNLRGVKESVIPLVPVFVVFLATHAFAILAVIGSHLMDFDDVARTTAAQAGAATAELGPLGLIVLILRSYSMGAGTYTGIEAVSNGMPILREPRVQTARTTMRYMAASLAFVASGLMIAYLLLRVGHQPGRTLNAVLVEKIGSGWGIGGRAFVLVTLVSEAVLLFVAAQTGFVDGPRVLANMSVDRWLPSQFSLLSERLVIKNGIVLMAGAAAVLMLASGGSVRLLVVLYAINVFITFCLSQTGMVRHWWTERARVRAWKRKIAINGFGLMLTGFILVSQIVIKFREGGWITIAITGSLVAVAVVVKRYYLTIQKKLARLDHLMVDAASVSTTARQAGGTVQGRPRAPRALRKGRTAVILVSGFNGTGLHTLAAVQSLFTDSFRNWFFIEAGIVDADRFKGVQGVEQLREQLEEDLARYVSFMKAEGFYAEGFSALGTDIVEEIVDVAGRIHRRHPGSVFFGGQMVFDEETFLSRLLLNHTTFATQRRLHQLGIPFLIMPIRLR